MGMYMEWKDEIKTKQRVKQNILIIIIMVVEIIAFFIDIMSKYNVIGAINTTFSIFILINDVDIISQNIKVGDQVHFEMNQIVKNTK